MKIIEVKCATYSYYHQGGLELYNLKCSGNCQIVLLCLTWQHFCSNFHVQKCFNIIPPHSLVYFMMHCIESSIWIEKCDILRSLYLYQNPWYIFFDNYDF